ncbi:hypothetical protein Z043_120078 [Scleropages formosus]|uniref:Immunoglobulin V-set domain-containing protein n=1 Tax=Scleropages formosus TaxID=113540 RepID=A0A0P7UK31_SCLFO|nr:hypothetical protein Z043_120078 [Scleropages formosus]
MDVFSGVSAETPLDFLIMLTLKEKFHDLDWIRTCGQRAHFRSSLPPSPTFTFPASSGHAVTVRTLVGQSVTLPCSYDVAYHGPLHICWGRGEIPINGCNHQIIETDGYKVKRRVSDRYQLFGDLAKGDVSLTIVDANEGDGGKYGHEDVNVTEISDGKKNGENVVSEQNPTQ